MEALIVLGTLLPAQYVRASGCYGFTWPGSQGVFRTAAAERLDDVIMPAFFALFCVMQQLRFLIMIKNVSYTTS